MKRINNSYLPQSGVVVRESRTIKVNGTPQEIVIIKTI